MSTLALAQASQRLRRRPGRAQGAGHVLGTSPSQVVAIAQPVPRQLDQQSNVLPRLLGVRQAAGYLSISMWSVRHLLQAGELHKVTVPGVGRVLIDRLDIDQLVERWKLGGL